MITIRITADHAIINLVRRYDKFETAVNNMRQAQRDFRRKPNHANSLARMNAEDMVDNMLNSQFLAGLGGILETAKKKLED